MKSWSPAVLALTLARNLDRDLDRARARDLDQDLDRDLARVLDNADALARALADSRALADARTLADARVLVYDLAVALARARNLACSRARARNLVRTLSCARNRTRVLDCSLHAAAWSAGGAGSIPGRVPRRLVELVVRMLPEHDRQRIREELCAELVDLPRRKQLGHALRVLARTWELRRVLTKTVRTPDGARARRAKR